MKDPLISIVIPIYNVEKYLQKCIKSVVDQSYRNLEIILVDDGSPDNCPQICDEWKKRDERIIVVHKENGGLSDARNRGISLATGKYIGFVDSDDFIELDMYKDMVEKMEETGSEIACCGRVVFHDNNMFKPKLKYCCDEIQCFDSHEGIKQILEGGYIEEAVWDKLYLKDLFDDVLFPKGENNEDIVTVPILFANAKKIVHVGKPYYHYRYTDNSISKSSYNQSKRIVIDHLAWVKLFIKMNYKDLMNSFYVLQARYCLSKCRALLSDYDSLREYKEDLNIYYSLLKDAFPAYIRSEYASKKDKVRAMLVVSRLYRMANMICSKV